MWGASEEPSGTMESGPPEAVAHTKETCEQNKSQLESLKEIMIRNQQSLKKKEEEVQEYARRLSKIKSRAKLSRRSKEGTSSSKDTAHKTESQTKDMPEEVIDDISQAKTPKAKSSLLQRKLAENRKAFEQRSRELTETKRAVEEKVEAIRQKLDETDLAAADQLAVTPIRPLMITSDMMASVQVQDLQEKEKKIKELSSKIVELEATILDLQENIKEKDSVIDSKTKAVTLMSADLSKKGKTTLDTLEDTKDEMRTMQENFVLIETSLKTKNASLLEQLQERDNRILELEHTVNRIEEQLKEQKIAESASADFSRSTMDTLAETKDAMKSMQENFVLIESSLKIKNNNLLQQLEDYEMKLAEARNKIFQLESGAGIAASPTVEDLQFRIEKLEQNNRQLLDEKYELQKNVAELQDKIIATKSVHGNDAIIEKDNRIAELENLIEELKHSNELLKEESKAELQKQVADLSSRNEEYSNRIADLENQVHELETERNDIAARLSAEQTAPKEDDVVRKLTKELEDLNKNMIKLKAQHKSKVKSLQKQLDNFKMVSDTNAELVRLGNQVALLEEEKASAGDWQERIADLESKVASQTKDIQMHIEAIAILENQKLDLTQELHAVKQEVSALEAENAESENLRVTAEMKVVELEEQLEATQQSEEPRENKLEFLSEYHELLKKLDALTQENSELYNKLSKMEEKGASDTGSTESFEAIHVNDRNDLLKKIEELERKNNELTLRLTKLEEKEGSHAGSTESFETINDTDRHEMLKKIEQLTRENSDLTVKLSRLEEKGSSDTGSTESFERIPEHNDSTTKIELLTQENNELVIKLTKLEEQLSQIESGVPLDVCKIDNNLDPLGDDLRLQIDTLTQEKYNLMAEVSRLQTQVTDLVEKNSRLQDRVGELTTENDELAANHAKLMKERLDAELLQSVQVIASNDQINILRERIQVLEKELDQMQEAAIEQSVNVASCETDDAKSIVRTLEREKYQLRGKIEQLEQYNDLQRKELVKLGKENNSMLERLKRLDCDDSYQERMELIKKLEELCKEKESVARERQELQDQISALLRKSSDELSEKRKAEEAVSQETQTDVIVTSLEEELNNSKLLIAEYKNQIEEMNMKLQSMEAELQEKTERAIEFEKSTEKLEVLERELKDMFATAEEWKFKYEDMRVKMQVLEQAKLSIEEAFEALENDNKELLGTIKEKDEATFVLQEQLRDVISSLETKLNDKTASVTAKESEITELKAELEKKDEELHNKYVQLQNGMITIDSLQEELNACSIKLKENDAAMSSLLAEITKLRETAQEKEEEIHDLKNNVTKITEMLHQSKPLAEFNEVVENLRVKETNYIELRSNHEEIVKENNELRQKIEDVENELIKKEQKIDGLLVAKRDFDTQIEKFKSNETEAEKRVWELQVILDNQTTYAGELRSELANEYKQMEDLKSNHTEEITMLNRRLQNVIEELVEKTQENEAIKAELKQKEELLGKNFTEEAKAKLEDKVAELEQTLLESENKLQVQSEKMKRIVATFNKKKAACQELEARVAELEEKWTTEKDEKEVKNKQVQEVENSMREKDNKIADLEEKLLQAQNETAEALTSSDKFAKECSSLKEKITILMEQNAEMGEEIETQRAEMERIINEMARKETTREDIAAEYELYKRTTSKEIEQKQAILEEVKEEARELRVRMQVMETEYVEQLATIKNLMAENGLLSSKQTQIDEKLENAEKESEKRRVLIEQLQKEIAVLTTAATVQASEQNLKEDDVTQHCDHSEQCQNLVQALEARLQERQAEIENLNNELANSYGNIVLLHDESQRYNNMMMQTAQERFNQSLMDQTNTLQQEIDSLKTEKAASEQRIAELEAELEEYKRKNVECKVEVPEVVEATETSTTQSNEQREQDVTGSSVASDASDKKEIERPESLLNETENRCSGEHAKEIDLLHKNLEEERLRSNELQKQLEDVKNELKRAEYLLLENNTHIDSLNTEFELMFREVSELRQTQEQYDTAKAELERFQQSIEEKNAQIDSLNAQLDRSSFELNNLTELREQYRAVTTESERFQQLLSEKNALLDSLIADHRNVQQQMSAQMQHQEDIEAHMRNEISSKDIDIEVIKAELTSAKETVKALTEERDQLSRILESSSWIDNLEEKGVSDTDVIRELQRHISVITKERNTLQLQLNDLTRTLKESEIRIKTQQYLQVDLQNALEEKIRAQRDMMEIIRNLHYAHRQESEIFESRLEEFKSTVQQESEQVNTAVEEPISRQEHAQSAQAPVEREVQKVQLNIGSGWNNDSSVKLNVDEETWGWNEDIQFENIQLAGDEHLSTPLISNTEIQLRVQMEELQDKIKDLTARNENLVEESKAAQVKSAKLIKKVKEYKVQVESLQQELKMQKQARSFFDLDTAIEEELKAQIANLEKTIGELKEEKKNIVAEKEALLKRLDVLMSANDRYIEMKERQDMEIEVLRIRNKELNNKLQSFEWQLQENVTTSETTSPLQREEQAKFSDEEVENQADDRHGQPQKRSVESIDDFEATSRKYKEEIDDLKDELEALAAENEQLQHFLEEQKITITNLESNKIDTNELLETVNTLKNQIVQLQTDLDKGKKEYDVLRKQYEQSLMDAHEEVTRMRHISDVFKTESKETIDKLQAEIESLQRESLREKEGLENKIKALMNSEEKLSTVNTSLIMVTELLNARVQEVADLKQEVQVQYLERQRAEATLQSEIQNLTKELAEKKQELGLLRQLISDKEHELVQQKNVETVSTIVTEATQELVQKHAIELEEKNKEMHDLTQKLTALQSTVDEYVSRLRDNAAQLDMQRQQIAYLKEDLTERNSIIGSTQDAINSMNEKLREKEQELTRYEEEKLKLTAELDRSLANLQRLQSQLNETEAAMIDIQEYNSRIRNMEQEIQVLKSEKESILLQYERETKTYRTHLESNKEEIAALKHDLREKTEQLHLANTQFCVKQNELEEVRTMMNNKDSLLEIANQELDEKRVELEVLRNEQPQSNSRVTDDLPLFKMDKDDDAGLQSTIDELRAQIEAKQQELEHLKYILSENTYPTIIQQMQDRINCLYNEKTTLEASLQATTQTLTEKQEQVNFLTQCIHGQSHEHISKEEVSSLSRDRRSMHDQEEIVRLQNEAHAKEQEINELKYIIAEKDSQLCIQEPQSDDFELREIIQRLTGELYGKEQEIQVLKSTIAELEEEVLRLRNFERLSEESRNAVERLSSEKEQIRIEAEEFLKKELQAKESEISEIKQRLLEENKKLLSDLRLRDNDVENLKTQFEQLQVIATERSDKLQRKEDELMHVIDDLAEKERRLAELSITKDAELHNLRTQIREKDARVEELLALSMEEEKQLDELRQTLTAREEEVNRLKELLDQKVSEYEMIQHALKKDVSVIEAAIPKSSETAQTADKKETISSELDLALYMLHQRDVRCEELTHELMQLLEERDTLQLRLSNAIRINEELRRGIGGSIEESSTKDSSSTSQALLEPVAEQQPSPSKSEGPVEIAKEAIDAPIEDKEALNLKLSQLHSVSHTKDVRLKDERELRHTQQMSLLAHRDVLSTLPPEAAARLVNANYTLSRDVQSQSSVLLNWLWGKSTPKVVHM